MFWTCIISGFKRKEFRGKLAIAITANFINRNSHAEASVEEISGVAFIFNQKFFKDLNEECGIDLENIVYYKDETHYFVMTAKKQSLLEKGVLKQVKLNEWMQQGSTSFFILQHLQTFCSHPFSCSYNETNKIYQNPFLKYAIQKNLKGSIVIQVCLLLPIWISYQITKYNYWNNSFVGQIEQRRKGGNVKE